MATIFDTMTKEEALAYCHKHRKQFISDLYASGGEGIEQFDCLIAIIEGDTIQPSQLPEYGMDYEEAQQVQALAATGKEVQKNCATCGWDVGPECTCPKRCGPIDGGLTDHSEWKPKAATGED